MSDRNADGRVWTFLVAGLILLAATYAVLKPAPASKPVSPSQAIPALDPSKIPLVSGDEPIDLLFVKAGCPVCHTIPGIPGADGRVGPKLVLGTTGGQRLADPRYRGEAKTVREYVIESVLNPGVYVVRGYPDQAMPRWYGQKLSATALERIAGYLGQLKEQP